MTMFLGSITNPRDNSLLNVEYILKHKVTFAVTLGIILHVKMM